MLPFYAKQFSTVEINHSFYRMPTETALLNWANAVPEGFRFALKANQKITHIQRLRDCESTLKRFLEVASVLNDGNHLGPILVQLPPNFKFDRPLLEEFLALRPPAFLFAFEVRHHPVTPTKPTPFFAGSIRRFVFLKPKNRPTGGAYGWLYVCASAVKITQSN